MPTAKADGGIVTQRRANKVRSFHVASRAEIPEVDREPLEFDLDWKDIDGNEAKSQVFHARPWLIPDLLLMQIPNMEIDMNSVPLFKVFEKALGDDYRAFYAFINSDEVFVDASAFVPILEWFVEEGTGRPTEPS